MIGFGKEVRDRLQEAGCEFVRHGKGDHDINPPAAPAR
jgi:hypothetical protein